MGATIINFEPEKCFECDGRRWVSNTTAPLDFLVGDGFGREFRGTTIMLTVSCPRCGGTGWE